jgi:hypothetical protein
MNTLKKEMSELTELIMEIGVGLENDGLCVTVQVDGTEMHWPAKKALTVGQDWINKGVDGIKDCTFFELTIDGLTGLVAPENLMQAGIGLMCAAYMLNGAGIASTWLEEVHGFGLDAEAVCAMMQPENPESLSS